MGTDELSKKPRIERQRRLVGHVLDAGFASAAELASLTGVSVMTIHRDIDDLARRGILRKVSGGVSALPSTVFEASSEIRMQLEPGAKQALARVAATFVEAGMSVLLDDSTTVLALARLLNDKGPLTVLTNYRQALEVFRENDDVRLIVIGGQYSRTHDSFIGLPSDSSVTSYSVDVVFQSTSTMGPHMTYHQEQDVVHMKRAMLKAGARRVLMMDGSKVGRTSLHHYVPVSDFTDVVLTDDVPAEVIAQLREHCRVHLAPR
ncbi:MAG: Glycerol-3-phosphate regulon repressor, DeoR family [uncultured Arthrobacter sp.]|uniref:Glycerol-3-phosphate regulon repressor, DeoR family n=1 Tax=uncultured Arthrobacter sp. TaxID=114050 RepID=A0A6J4IA16_9MICC|nr:DeoR/GlpR family DNA-binding transcription regulator [uncultured Arthrobacter sp.]CAA9244465.1 MAG: Glycerol-3-phosphate regulon repressor, DeoR family [uncultured Arthrobacter sp.]